VTEPKPTFVDREIALRVDFDDIDEEGFVVTSVRFMLGPRHPVEGDLVFLADSRGNSCFGKVHALSGWLARIEPDWTSWHGPWEPPRGRKARLAPKQAIRALKPQPHGSSRPATV
jgi:hypothetical protein